MLKKILFVILSLAAGVAFSQTIWTGPRITFTKLVSENPREPEGQDRITETVWITRGGNAAIFNASTENSANNTISPEGTEWAIGTSADTNNLTFAPFRTVFPMPKNNIVGQDLVLHLIEENIFIDVRFLEWTTGSQGASFTYERSTNQIVGVSDLLKESTEIYPNPSNGGFVIIKSEFLTRDNSVRVLDTSGRVVLSPVLTAGAGSDFSVDLSNLEPGAYILSVVTAIGELNENIIIE